jgi:hypothetical protein
VALSASADVLHSVTAFAQSPLRPGVLDDITDVASVATLRKQVRARAQSFDTTSASRDAIATARTRSRQISGSMRRARLAATREVSETSRPASRRTRTARRAARRAGAPRSRDREKKKKRARAKRLFLRLDETRARTRDDSSGTYDPRACTPMYAFH